MAFEVEILKAITDTMTCDACPCQCKAKENSSLANCSMHWSEMLSKIDPACNWREIRHKAAELRFTRGKVKVVEVGKPTRQTYLLADTVQEVAGDNCMVITGKWERHYSRPGVYADLFWWCSRCKQPTGDQWAGHCYKYCPNCGAKMEKATDEP